MISLIAPEHVEPLWPIVRPFIERAIMRGGEGLYRPGDVLLGLLTGSFSLWVYVPQSVEAAVVTQIIDFPQKRVCYVPWIGGRNLRDWEPQMRAAIEDYARRNGCTAMRGGARKGWARTSGYRVTGVSLVKEL